MRCHLQGQLLCGFALLLARGRQVCPGQLDAFIGTGLLALNIRAPLDRLLFFAPGRQTQVVVPRPVAVGLFAAQEGAALFLQRGQRRGSVVEGFLGCLKVALQAAQLGLCSGNLGLCELQRVLMCLEALLLRLPPEHDFTELLTLCRAIGI